MISSKLSLLVIAGVIAVCSAHSYRLKECPKVAVKKDFEMERFLGDWYVIARFNPTSTCSKINIDKTEDDTYLMSQSNRPFGLDILRGLYPRGGRKLTIMSNKTEAIFRINHPFAPFTIRTFGIIDTDYDNYAVVWGCERVILGSLQNLDILSRKPEMDKDLLKEQIKKADEFGIEVNLLAKIDQIDCSINGTKNESDWLNESINNMFVETE